MKKPLMNRRQFLTYSAGAGGALLLAACGPSAEEEAAAAIVRRTDSDEVMVGDVQQYELATDKWEGDWGWVTLKVHEAVCDGKPVLHIRTDSGDQAYATKEKLVFVPLLNAGRSVANKLYVFDDDRTSVMRSIPTHDDYSSLFHIINVSGDGEFDSAESIIEAGAAGTLTLDESDTLVNFPLLRWDGGELPVDEANESPLGGGPLVEPINTSRMTATFKLHQCFPGSRYIVTDTSAVPMAPMMGIVGSAITQELKEMGGTDEIWVFANGIAGPGAMGFQPAVFDNKAGEAAWSPFWDHLTIKWKDESKAKVLRTSAEIRELVASGDLEQFNGVPDSHPNGFVVNCPAPILTPNNFSA